MAEFDEFALHTPMPQVGLSVAMRITSFRIATDVDGHMPAASGAGGRWNRGSQPQDTMRELHARTVHRRRHPRREHPRTG